MYDCAVVEVNDKTFCNQYVVTYSLFELLCVGWHGLLAAINSGNSQQRWHE